MGRAKLGLSSAYIAEIHEAGREALTEALQRPGSKARNVRGQLAVSQFKAVGHRIWPT